jgi:hypothetical protein
MAKTRVDMNQLVNTKISANATDRITALEHNEVATEVLKYATEQVVAGGSVYVGDILGGDNVFGPISLGITIPSTNYTIVGHFTSLIQGGGGQWDYDNDAVWQLCSKLPNSFSIEVGEWGRIGQNLDFDWLAITTGPTVITI